MPQSIVELRHETEHSGGALKVVRAMWDDAHDHAKTRLAPAMTSCDCNHNRLLDAHRFNDDMA